MSEKTLEERLAYLEDQVFTLTGALVYSVSCIVDLAKEAGYDKKSSFREDLNTLNDRMQKAMKVRAAYIENEDEAGE